MLNGFSAESAAEYLCARLLVPHVLLFERYFVTTQELPKFVLKSDLEMVIRLILDVSNECLDLRLPHRETAVPALPSELFYTLGLNPS